MTYKVIAYTYRATWVNKSNYKYVMKYYKYIDLDYKIFAEKMKSYIFSNGEMFKTFWTQLDSDLILSNIPETSSMFKPYNINVMNISITRSFNTNSLLGLHRDYSEAELRINIPILNCEKSVTNFYYSTVDPTLEILANGIPYLDYNYKNCTLVDSFCLDRPAILRVKEIHQVVANANYLPRISCTIDFKENIFHLFE